MSQQKLKQLKDSSSYGRPSPSAVLKLWFLTT